MTINFKPTIKQNKVFELFKDQHTTECLFGGGIGSSKSYMLAAITTLQCLSNAGIRVGLARNELTTLKKTTVTSFFELFGDWNLENGKDYRYNSIEGTFTFDNGSQIIFQELRYLPSDPNYTRLGGLLLTFGVIDEASECDAKGKEIFQSRLGRWKNDKFNIKPMLIMTCNPSKNFLYDDFYLANKEGTMAEHRAFVNATVFDNPYISEAYIENQKRTLSPNEMERLLYGNWEFDGNPNKLLTMEEIRLCYDNTINLNASKEMFISADIAFTSDACVIMIWKGLDILKITNLDKGANVEEEIKKLAVEYKVPVNHIAYDSDGVGKYLMNYLKGAKPIINNAKALKDENYKNLKTQLYFKMCDLIREGKVKILDGGYKKLIEQELGAIEHKTRDTTEGKIEMNSKSDVKRMIGRSPDYSDAMAYRMLFEFSNPRYVIF